MICKLVDIIPFLNHAIGVTDSILISSMLKPCIVCILLAAADIWQYDQSRHPRRAPRLTILITMFYIYHGAPPLQNDGSHYSTVCVAPVV